MSLYGIGKELHAAKKRRIRARRACERCHRKKVKCDFAKPCSTCVAANASDSCEYLVLKKPEYVSIQKEQLETLLRDLEKLQNQVALANSQILKNPRLPETEMALAEELKRSLADPMSLKSILDNGSIGADDPDDNPLVSDQNIPQLTTDFTYMGDSACSKFSTKLQQYVSLYHFGNRTALGNLVRNAEPVRYEDPELHWNSLNRTGAYTLPDKNDALTWTRIAYRHVGIEYYMVMPESFNKLIDRIYEVHRPGKAFYTVPKPLKRAEMAQFFAMCALGSLYSGSFIDGVGKVPGTRFFKVAVSMVQDCFETPTLEYIEALSQIGYYSFSLNRIKSAFVYTGLALRLAVCLGLHRRSSFWNNTSWDLKTRERARRLFYTLYIFDRLVCSKLGYPVSLEDQEIDTEFPSEMYFTEQEYKEFPDSKYILLQIQIASISTLIVRKIYGLHQDKQSEPGNTNFVKSVHQVLSLLKDCYDKLDPTLKLPYYNNQSLHNVLRNIFSFHMHYNQLVILATRPILLYAFIRALRSDSFVSSQLTTAIAEACIQSAYAINSTMSTVFKTGKISSFGFFDAHYSYSSTMILIIAKTLTQMDEMAQYNIQKRIDTLTEILQNLADLGSIPATHFIAELRKLIRTFDQIDTSKVAKIFSRTDLQQEGVFTNHVNVKEQESDFFSPQEVLQVLNNFALDDEGLRDFFNIDFDQLVDENVVSQGINSALFDADDFHRINVLFRELHEA